jgi:hypothetical protein
MLNARITRAIVLIGLLGGPCAGGSLASGAWKV